MPKNPQLDDGFIRIANELYDEILRRNFTKRQQNIVLFIWRLSYGCGKKECIIDKFNYFELAGLDKSDIKKELKYLKMCNVLQWDEQTMIFAINKDYDLWQINPNKNWDDDKFKKLIALNLKVGKIPTDVGKTPTDDMVGETPTNVGKIPTEVGKTPTLYHDEVGKIPTTELVKYQLQEAASPRASRDSEAVNTILNTINNKEEEVDPVIDLLIKNNIVKPGGINYTLYDDLKDIEDNFGFENPNEMIVEAIKDAARGNGRTWKFVYNKLDLWRKQGIKNKEQLQEYLMDATPKPKRNGQARKTIDWEAL
ncbi:DnaD-like helicase loader [Geobacillus phage GBK2]|uniref:DnaD-like helicase loader n=1 Tax=Geobacillus phage GBK2 TaxID=1458842 RepID=UPI0003F1F38D|nr:DnaD-like helicase loader [Geobacillus phage GBK2]AHJ88643.1 primase [Geobacillus phage GBK2]